jgi:REP element-mobilizing transposase RayT
MRAARLGATVAAMGREARDTSAGRWRHVNTKVVEESVLARDGEDNARFLRILAHVVGKLGWELAAYALLSTHYHLVLRTIEDDLDAGMKVINGFYAQTFNKRWGRRGHLFGARYDARAIETQGHALNVAAYVPLNPVRAGLCQLPQQWPWSSYAATIGLRPKPWLLTDDWLLGIFDSSRPRRAQASYHSFVTSVLLAETAAAAGGTTPMVVPGT